MAQVGAAWERAVGTLKGVLDAAFQGATAAPAMLTVKDFMLLVCLALGEWHNPGRILHGFSWFSERQTNSRGRSEFVCLPSESSLARALCRRRSVPCCRRAVRLSRGGGPGDTDERARQIPQAAGGRHGRGGAGAFEMLVADST